MFDALADRLEGVLGRLRNRGRLTEEIVDEALQEIRTALLEADVELGVVRSFVAAVRERCVGLDLSQALTPGQQVVQAVHDELIRILGGETLRISYASRPPTVVLLAGLQGAGKTTAAAKLAAWFKQQGRNPMMVGADLQRPAAVEQLRVLGGQVGVTVFSEATDPVSVAKAGLAEARRIGRDVLVIDTAGRLSIDAELMDEVRRVSEATTPDYTFLVIDAMTGQDAVGTALAFHQALELDGVILTKLDGDARGGAALSVKEVVGRPIAFASTGEKLADFDLFHPDRMAERILGMGDVLSLIEQAERDMDRDVAMKGASRMLGGEFTLEDFLEQLQQVKKMGPLSGVLGMLPGVGKDLKEASASLDDGHFGRIEAIIHSMTPEERTEPSLIDGSRRTRIANGSGTSSTEVNGLLRQFKDMQKLMKSMSKGGPAGMLGGLSGLLGGKGMGGGPAGLAGRAGMAGLARNFGDMGPEAEQALSGLGPDVPAALGPGGLFGGAGGAGIAGGAGNHGKGVGGARTQGSAPSTSKGAKKGKKGGRVTPKSR